MTISAEQGSKFAALHRQWWRLQMSETFLSGTKNTKHEYDISNFSDKLNWHKASLDRVFLKLYMLYKLDCLYKKMFRYKKKRDFTSNPFRWFIGRSGGEI